MQLALTVTAGALGVLIWWQLFQVSGLRYVKAFNRPSDVEFVSYCALVLQWPLVLVALLQLQIRPRPTLTVLTATTIAPAASMLIWRGDLIASAMSSRSRFDVPLTAGALGVGLVACWALWLWWRHLYLAYSRNQPLATPVAEVPG